MDFGRVIGRMTAVIKDKKLADLPLLIVEGVNHDGTSANTRFVAADAIGVGHGEFVWYETSTEAAMAWADWPPIDAAIVGIVDEVHVKNQK